MNIKRAWAFQSFIVCFLLNSIFAGLIFLMTEKVLEGLGEWVIPLTGEGAMNLPDNARAALSNTGLFIVQLRQYMVPALAALTFAATFLLWLAVFWIGRRHIDRASAAVEHGNPDIVSGDETAGSA
ncbi:MAG: hypothetical protein ABFD97_22260 [Syntrophobacter sp.]